MQTFQDLDSVAIELDLSGPCTIRMVVDKLDQLSADLDYDDFESVKNDLDEAFLDESLSDIDESENNKNINDILFHAESIISRSRKAQPETE